MFTRLIESAIIAAYNGVLRGRLLAPRRRQGAPLHADQVLLGHVIPDRPAVSGEAQAVTLSADGRRRHLYVLGATGTGKTNMLMRLIASDIEANRSFCVIDLRGDLVDRILLRLATSETADTIGERLLLIDLRDEKHIVGFNPLLGAGDIYSRAFHLLAVIRAQSESWGIQLEETLRNSLVALAEAGWSMLEIEPLLSNAAFRAQVLSKVSDSYVRSFFARYGELSEEKQTAWRLPVLNKVTPLLAIPQLRLMFGQRQSFSFGPVLDTEPGRIILISLAVDRLHQAAYLVGGLFVSSFQGAIMARANQPEAARIPVFLYLDEFETMATSSFEAIVAEGRRFGLGLTLSHQNGHQIPVNLRHVLRNNVHTQVFFQTGALDAADLATEIAGKVEREAVRTTLMTQGVGEAYVVRRGEPSVRVKVLHAPDPKVESQTVQALRKAAFAVYARPRADVERELAAREKSLGASPSQSIEPGSASETRVPPTYEIRHDKPKRKYSPKSVTGAQPLHAPAQEGPGPGTEGP